jgi:hypothetical protein
MPRRRAAAPAVTFEAVLEDGHKGAAVIVPFDPQERWGLPPRPVASATYGVRPGHVVRGTLNGTAFEGWIGNRWGRFFVLVDERLRKAAGAAVGGTVRVTLAPREDDDPRPAAPAPRRRAALRPRKR